VRAPAWQVWTALGLVYVVWGSTYLGIRYVVESLPALLTASARFLLAAGLLTAYLLLRRGLTAFRGTRREYATAAGVGVLLLCGGNGGVTLAEQADLPSGLAALLVAGVPLWVVVLRASRGDRPSARTVLGVVLGFAGLAVLLLPGARPQGVALGAVLLVVGSSMLWAVGSFVASRLPLPADPLVATVVEMLGGAVGLAVIGVARGESLDLSGARTSSVVAFGYLVLFGSIVAFTAYSWLLTNAPISWVSTYAYVNPVVAVLLGALFVSERITLTSLVGGGVTLLAVAVVVSEDSSRTADQTVDERQGRARSSAT
jgi:drug/metabolite transporter (DMT)-like permease